MSEPSEKVKPEWDWDSLDGRELPPVRVDYDDRNWLDVESIIGGLDLHDKYILKPKEQAMFDKYADALFCLYEIPPNAASNSGTSSVVLGPESNAPIPKKRVARSSSVPALRKVECVSPAQGTHADRSKPIKSKTLNTRYELETSNCSGTATEKPPSSPWSKKRKFESPTHEVSKEIQELASSYGSVYKTQNRANAKNKKRKLANGPQADDGEWKPGRSPSKEKAWKKAAGRSRKPCGDDISSMTYKVGLQLQRVE